MSLLNNLIILFSFLTNYRIHTQDFQSRCPHLYIYEGTWTEPDRWYGVIALVPNTDSFRLIFDKPAVELVVVNLLLTYISTRDYLEFLVEIPAYSVQENIPQIVRFYVRYNPNKPAPNLRILRMNDKTVCPNVTRRNDFPTGMELQRGPFITNMTANNVNENENRVRSPSLSSSNNSRSGDICGTVVVQPKRLQHGQTTYEGEFPWHAAVYRKNYVGPFFACGASLISKYHVLTAAHCITIRRSRIPMQVTQLEVFLGVYYTKRFYNYNLQRRHVLKMFIHPEYRPTTYNYDIAIVKLVTPVDITDYVRPVCLWEDSLDLQSIVDKQGTVVGWSYDDASTITEQLMHVKMPIVSQETCIFSAPDFFARFTSKRTYCAGKLNDLSTCSVLAAGNGMVFPKSKSNQENPSWQIRGFISITILTEVRCDPSFYVVFTDIVADLDWIRRSLK